MAKKREPMKLDQNKYLAQNDTGLNYSPRFAIELPDIYKAVGFVKTADVWFVC